MNVQASCATRPRVVVIAVRDARPRPPPSYDARTQLNRLKSSATKTNILPECAGRDIVNCADARAPSSRVIGGEARSETRSKGLAANHSGLSWIRGRRRVIQMGGWRNLDGDD